MNFMKLDIQKFAASISISAYETNPLVENNTSYVHLKIVASTSGESYNLSGTAYVNCTLIGQNNTLSIPTTHFTINKNSTVVVYEGNVGPFNHNDDGSLNPISINATSYITPSYSPSANSNCTMSTIARKSSFSATDADIESTSTISINRASSSFTHTLTYSFGSLSDTIATGVGTSYSWTIPSSFYAQISNTQTGTCTITCITYSGSTEVGRTSGTITITANETLCRPNVSGTMTDINNTTVDLTGDNSKLVRYKSTANVIGIATAKNGASISSITVNGGSNPRTYTNCSIDSFTVVATDSRGYSNSITITPTIIPYVILTNKATFRRTTQTGSEITLSYSGNYYNGSFGDTTNSLTLSWAYREKGTSTWNTGGTLIPTISNNKYSGSISCGNTFNYQTDYEFIMYYSDTIDSLNTGTITVTKGQGALEIYNKAVLFKGNVICFENSAGILQIGQDLLDAIFPIGTCYITSNVNVHPAQFLGGTWALVSTFVSSTCLWQRTA